ncbi:hypothetical protein M0Q97_13515 [Candidatus Dojkabacteria bacterium]|jgi:hypothetical protein|nr:hypothetical protein [Candidatus Dojkabacteria bacterium]
MINYRKKRHRFKLKLSKAVPLFNEVNKDKLKDDFLSMKSDEPMKNETIEKLNNGMQKQINKSLKK